MLHIHIPAAPLTQYVEYFWLWENYQTPHPMERILPHGSMELMLNLCDTPFRIQYPGEKTAQDFHGLLLAGGRSEHFIVDTSRPTTILNVYFKPGGALALFGVAAYELHNQHIPLNLLWGSRADEAYEQLLMAQSPDACFSVLEAVLLAALMQAKMRHQAVAYALHSFGQSASGLQIAEVVDRIGLSATRFIQVFKEDTGFTPKRYTRLLRFQQAVAYLAGEAVPDYAAIALRCGYFDQAHFINEFRHFAGITPSQYTPQSPEHLLNIPYHPES